MLKIIRQCSFAFLILLVAFDAYSGERSPYGRYSGPRSLGPYSLDHEMPLKSLLAALGTRPSGKGTYCFADKDHGLYLYVHPKDDRSGQVANVLLSSFPNCQKLPILPATIDPKVWRTSEGIGIGSTKTEIVRAYGKPVFIRKLDRKNDLGVIAGVQEAGASQIEVGDSSYLYSCLLNAKEGCSDDLRVARMGFSEGKLIWIHMSNSE
jgi:hypothetical protein